MQDTIVVSNLTPNYYVLLGFFGLLGLVGVSTIAIVVHLWMKDRRLASHRLERSRTRRQT
jgi:hypothetical protein